MTKTLSRAQLGLARPNCVTPLPWSLIERLYVHYSASKADMGISHTNCPSRWRGIQHYHTHATPDDPTKPWCDIAYSFGFCQHGWRFEGRGWAVRTAANGTNEANDRGLAICFLGTDNKSRQDVTQEARKALYDFINDAERIKGKPLLVLPHSSAVGTDCPGDELRAIIYLKAWKHDKKAKQPELFWSWLAWHLGEGQFAKYGKANKKVRPAKLPSKVPRSWWLRRAAFLAKRKRG